MNLFVVNRHEDTEPISTEVDEKAKLDKVLKKIEKNKARRILKREENKANLAAIAHTLQTRQKRREIKAKLIPVPENETDEFVDQTAIPTNEEGTDEVQDEPTNKSRPKKKHKLDVTEVEGFTILGSETFDKKNKVKRVLPKWLLHPTVISVNLKNLETKVSQIKELDKTTRKLLKANGIKFLFPVQAQVVPWLIESHKHSDVIFPRDICVSAPTGSGKTLAFVLPVIQSLKRHTFKKIRALVILPTQDLAAQVYKTFRIYSQNTNLDVCLITGEHPFAAEQKQLVSENEAFGFVSNMDILVCTAGRLVDHLKLTKGLDLSNLEFLVIDEADRVLESVQNDWLYHLEKHIHQDPVQNAKILNLHSLQKRRPPQKLLFSATLSQDPEKLEKLSLFQPKLFTSVVENDDNVASAETNSETFVGKYTTPNELTEKFIVISLDLKPLALYQFIKQSELRKTIIFTHSVDSAHRLTILLKALFQDERKIEEISSKLQAKNRNELIKKFSTSEVDILISTDVHARGMDLPNVQCVISYSAPKYLKTYIHRAGRTARAGEDGLAVTLLLPSQVGTFNGLLKHAGKANVEEVMIAEEDLEPLGEQYKKALDALKKVVGEEKKSELVKNKLAKRTKSGKKRKRKDSVVSNSSK